MLWLILSELNKRRGERMSKSPKYLVMATDNPGVLEKRQPVAIDSLKVSSESEVENSEVISY
jgi:hypothetical protein